MHQKLVDEIVKICRQREREGDCPTVERPPAETLEFCILELAQTREFDWTDKERSAIDSLMISQGFTERQIMRQALARYQMACVRAHAGETETWSGDEARAREFRGENHD